MDKKYIAPINLSKLGFRYFRIVLESKAFSRKFIQYVVKHPNTGYVFQGTGWSGKKKVLGIGIWATNNAEMIDISHHLRSRMSPSYNVVYQSELTRLEFFAHDGKERKRMILIDELENKYELTPVEIEYLKLVSIDGSLSVQTLSNILGVSVSEITQIDTKLKKKGVYYGLFENKQLPKGYTKFFIDTSTLPIHEVEKFSSLLSDDTQCVYLARGNGKYNFEFEYVVKDKKEFNKKYSQLLVRSKHVYFDDNIFTNLFPQSKFNNIRKIQDSFIELAKNNTKYFDLRNSELWYTSHESARAYLNIYTNEQYKQHMNIGEVGLFEKAVQRIKKANETYNVIDLGSGDGTKGKQLIEKIGKENVSSYFPVDIQEIELSQAVRTHEGETYSIHPTILNFDNLSSRFPIGKKNHETNLYVLFGGTYGNFFSSKINADLKCLLENKSDKLWVTMPIREHMTEQMMLDSYLNENTENIGFFVLKQLGFEKSDFVHNQKDPKFTLQLRIQEDRVVSYFILKHPKTILGLHLESGTIFDITSSWKPTKEEFMQVLADDFTIDTFLSNKSFALAICSRNEKKL